MASSKEAFERLWMWKKSRTLLRVVLLTKGDLPEGFVGAVVRPREDLLTCGFANHGDRTFCEVDFSDCTFRVGARTLLAERGGAEFFKCEDTGERWRGTTPLDM